MENFENFEKHVKKIERKLKLEKFENKMERTLDKIAGSSPALALPSLLTTFGHLPHNMHNTTFISRGVTLRNMDNITSAS